MKLSGFMIGSDDAKRLGEFYTKVFGEPGYHEGDWYGWQDTVQMMIGSHSEVHGKNESPARIMLTITTKEVAEEYDRIIECGATEVAKPYHPGDSETVWLATVADPDGNYIQLATPWDDQA